eukprot:CAMPEP_0185902804 /NCGR_PEP_ID=MMETSP0196C-20130402/2020_1 /TAXON_ID=2932 /ORGANISM="Alexandrium fundyense, Strain CCMP1719" /LENGTH=152 /DNA_ID=CAMNT_0028621715 /DNA_START=157 /DNA_END=613 /DNA_ORIENTATION=+
MSISPPLLRCLATTRSPLEVGGLEELFECELLALRLEQETSPFVEGCRDEAAEDHHDEQGLGRCNSPLWDRLEQTNRAVVAGNAIDDVTDDGRHVRLVDVAPVHWQLHGLPVPEFVTGKVAEVKTKPVTSPRTEGEMGNAAQNALMASKNGE